uniref:Uncharacterized protein n=1 Tax=Rhipicephalus appendiculatus TaxID=34631 RepID=A0A131YCN5_RHIAP
MTSDCVGKQDGSIHCRLSECTELSKTGNSANLQLPRVNVTLYYLLLRMGIFDFQTSGSYLAARASQRVRELVPVGTGNSVVVTCVGNPRQPEAARRLQNRTLGQPA